MQDDETVVSDLVAQALEHRDETGTEIDLDQLCGGRPDLQTKVEIALQAAVRLPMLQAAGIGGLPVLGDALSGRYRIQTRLGAGAMGVVYGAEDLELGRKVALKVLHHGVMERKQALARFEREAAALAAVRQDNVVTIFDRGFTEDGAPYLVMELVEGIPLSRVLETWHESDRTSDSSAWLSDELGLEGTTEPSFLRQSVRWAMELAAGLEAVHAAGIVHRDVKPSNIMIRWDGQPVILDFGAVLTEDDSDLTRTGTAVGTPAYMAPEALGGEEASQSQSDVYGLSATLYHLLTKTPPYTGTPPQVLSALATREPVPAVKLRPNLPKDLQAVLDRGMARKPKGRYGSATELRTDLKAFLSYLPVQARRITPLHRAARRLVRSRAVLGGAAVALVLLSLFGWSLWEKARTRQQDRAFAAEELYVPANYGLTKLRNRVVADEEIENNLGKLFDRMVATKGEPAVAYSLRAAYHLDHGQPAMAAKDMRSLAGELGTEYTNELANRYEAIPEDATDIRGLNLKEMPPPVTALDHYVAAYQALRYMRLDEARPLLAHEGLAGIRHAQELKVLLEVIPALKLDGDERDLTANLGYEGAIRIESRFGQRSAMTAHLAGFAMVLQGRYGEALPFCRDGLALAPAAHPTSINAARSAFRLGLHGEADEWVAHSIRLLPHYPKAYETGVLRRLSDFEYDEARAWLEQIPYPNTRSGAIARASSQIKISTTEALNAYLASDLEAARLIAEPLGDLAKEISEMVDGDQLTYASLCEAIVNGDESQIFSLLCERQIEEPLWPDHLRTLLKLIPKEVDPEAREKLQLVLDAIARALGRRQAASSAGSAILR